MNTKKIKITLQQLNDGEYRIEQLVNALSVDITTVAGITWQSENIRSYNVGQKITVWQAQALCNNPNQIVKINAVK